MSEKLLVDSSIFISAFDSQSQNYDISQRFLEWTVKSKRLITMPAHAWFEILCTLRRLERNDKTFKGRSVMGNWFYPLELIHIDRAFIEKYGNVDIRYIKGGDHIFLIIAKVNGYPLVTTDVKMKNVAESEGIRAFSPEEYMNS